ncbi:MAG TPA: YfhO family protein, partial [Candidatus Scatomorpha stercorigallinarum]|nr:YfhO family protein [Candidatus Scatomorpha stercorigallinarum]
MRAERRAPAHIAAFLLPAALLLAVYAAMGMWPFGDKTILASDMADQYVEFFCALKNGDVYFSWSKALGSSYIGVFSYYVS